MLYDYIVSVLSMNTTSLPDGEYNMKGVIHPTMLSGSGP